MSPTSVTYLTFFWGGSLPLSINNNNLRSNIMEYHVQLPEEQWLGKIVKDMVIETLVNYADMDNTNFDDCIAEIVVTNEHTYYDLMSFEYDDVDELWSFRETVWRTVRQGATVYVYSRDVWAKKRVIPCKGMLTVPLSEVKHLFILTPAVASQLKVMAMDSAKR